jgi:ribonuclease HI
LVYSKTFEEHLEHLAMTFERFRRAGLKLGWKKCHFGFDNTTILGHRVSADGTTVQEDLVEKIRSFHEPKDTHEIRRFLGMANFYRRFVESYSQIASPLHKLTRKGKPYEWTEDCQSAFEAIKEKLVSAPVLARPNFEKQFILQTDASRIGLGAFLQQEDENGHEHIIACASRGLTAAEKNYTATELECLAVVWALKHFHVYLHGQQFDLYSDHSALKWLLRTKDVPHNPRLTRWITQLQQYDFVVHYKKGKANQNADALSRLGY